MVRRTDGSTKGTASFNYDGSATATTSNSSTAGAKTLNDSETAEMGRMSFEEIASMAASVAVAKTEQIVAERLATTSQAEAKTAKMLAEATSMLASIKGGLETSVKMQGQLESDIANIKGSAIAALSMFVSFFAFITVSINVFSKAGSAVSAAALVVIFWSLLVGFNVMIGWQFNTLKYTGIAWFALVLTAVVSVVAIGVMYYLAPDMLMVAKPPLETK